MPVFELQFVEKVTRSNASRPASQRRDLHYFVTHPDQQALRDWIERTVDLVPEPGRMILTRRLQSDASFVTAVSEVAVASVLQEAGLQPEFERRFGDLTPDLFVPGTAESVPLIFEVWTRQRAQGEPGRRRDWQALVERVEKIPVGVSLLLVPKTRKAGPPDPKHVAEIGRFLHGWLTSDVRQPGQRCDVVGYQFQVWGPSPDGTHAFLPRPLEPGGPVNSDVVLTTIEDKVRKYRQLVTELGAAFVVVLAAEPGTSLSVGTVRSALAGQQALEFVVPQYSTQRVTEATARLRLEDKPPALDPALSAVGWVMSGGGTPTVHLFEAPSARVALPVLPTPAISRELIPTGHWQAVADAGG